MDAIESRKDSIASIIWFSTYLFLLSLIAA